MSTPAHVRTAMLALRDQYAPTGVGGHYYEVPAPLVVVPPSLHPKGTTGKRLTTAHAAYVTAADHLENADDALSDALSDSRRRDEATARRDAVAARLARGEAAPDDVESLLPAYSEADHLALVEVHAVAVGAARRNLAASVRAYDLAVEEIAPSIVPEAVSVADRLDDAAAQAEAAASIARAAATEARAVTFDLYLPQALAAVRHAGIGVSGGISLLDRASALRARALLSPVEGWSSRAEDYTAHPALPKAATYLGVNLVSKAPEDPAMVAAIESQRHASGYYADAMPKMVSGS